MSSGADGLLDVGNQGAIRPARLSGCQPLESE
jgi:hypothetical protein